MWFSVRAVAVAMAIGLAGCSNLPAEDPPPPPVERAPTELQGLAIHVHRLATPAQNEQDEWDYHNMPGYTRYLRGELVHQLQRAGYTVVVGRDQPRDCVAVVQATWPHDAPATATLVMHTTEGVPIATVSVEVPVMPDDYGVEHLEAHGAVELVHALSRSRELRAFARDVQKRKQLVIAE